MAISPLSRRSTLALSLSLAALVAMPARAADALDAIKQRGAINIAIDVSHAPYGMLDSSAKETGSDVETAKLLADDLGVKLQIVQVSGANRVPFLISGKADVVIASFSITEERKKVVAYSKPYGVVPVVVSAPKDAAIAKAEDLNDKTIAVARGTTADIELTKIVKASASSARIVRYEDEATANAAVATGQQDILAAALSTANAVRDANPGKSMEVKITMASYPMAIGLRKNDDAFKAKLDEWVSANLKNGKLNDIYRKYFGTALPAEMTN